MAERVWTISNVLSIGRAVLVLPIGWLMCLDEPIYHYYAVGLIVVAAFTDLFDGMVARKLNQVTRFGKIIDPIADKIAVGVASIILVVQGKLPVWFLLMVLVRDVLIFVGGAYVTRAKGITLESNWAGKWAVTAIALLLIITIIDQPEVIQVKLVLFYVSVVMLVISFGLYVKRFVKVISRSTPIVE